ncbi:MAG: hypothetical protein K2Z81_09970, partial [Cyanobacteria bacterium]|nr:hypothetical protein [Cyanobacteriota bacterium]
MQVKVGDYPSAELAVVKGTEGGAQNFEIRIPESKLSLNSSLQVADVYNDVYRVLKLDMQTGEPSALSLKPGTVAGSERSLTFEGRLQLMEANGGLRKNPEKILQILEEAAKENIAPEKLPWAVRRALRENIHYLKALPEAAVLKRLDAMLTGKNPETAMELLRQLQVNGDYLPKSTWTSVADARGSIDAQTKSGRPPLVAQVAEHLRLHSKADVGIVSAI